METVRSTRWEAVDMAARAVEREHDRWFRGGSRRCAGDMPRRSPVPQLKSRRTCFVDWEPPPGMSTLTPLGGVSLAWLSYSTIYAQRGTLAAYAHERPGDVASVPTTNNGHGMDKMEHAPSYDGGD